MLQVWSILSSSRGATLFPQKKSACYSLCTYTYMYIISIIYDMMYLKHILHIDVHHMCIYIYIYSYLYVQEFPWSNFSICACFDLESPRRNCVRFPSFLSRIGPIGHICGMQGIKHDRCGPWTSANQGTFADLVHHLPFDSWVIFRDYEASETRETRETMTQWCWSNIIQLCACHRVTVSPTKLTLFCLAVATASGNLFVLN